MKKEYNIKITNDNLKNTLNGIIDHPNKDAIIRLFIGMLANSHQAVDYFIKFTLNEPFPNIPEINSIGLVPIDKLIWNSEEREVLRESIFNENDCVKVTIQEFLGLHDYTQLRVSYPYIENSVNITKTTTIKLDSFILDTFELSKI
jgi:hypothetical protein